eukprot:4279806-Alexandrium_andersonii.AAC.1
MSRDFVAGPVRAGGFSPAAGIVHVWGSFVPEWRGPALELRPSLLLCCFACLSHVSLRRCEHVVYDGLRKG